MFIGWQIPINIGQAEQSNSIAPTEEKCKQKRLESKKTYTIK